jgi:Nucleotidyl transferase AbiEii toxin, Type IV TA system
MRFEVASDPDTPEIVGNGLQYDGYRFRAECRLAEKVYGARFGVDVALGGVVSGDVEEITTDDLLGFAGIAPPKLRVVPVETHLAEKLHAYTVPRDRPNTRVKDLPDLGLLGTIRPLEAAHVREAIKRTFGSRRVHPVPARLPSPPEAWTAPYARMAEQNELPWRTLAEVEAVVRAFLDPLLSSESDARWDPRSWTWSG